MCFVQLSVNSDYSKHRVDCIYVSSVVSKSRLFKTQESLLQKVSFSQHFLTLTQQYQSAYILCYRCLFSGSFLHIFMYI